MRNKILIFICLVLAGLALVWYYLSLKSNKVYVYSLTRFNAKTVYSLSQKAILSGKGIVNSKVIVYLTPGDIKKEIAVDKSGNWTYELPQTLVKDKLYRVTVNTLDQTNSLVSIKSYKIKIVKQNKLFNLNFNQVKDVYAQGNADEGFTADEIPWVQQMRNIGIYPAREDGEIVLYSKEQYINTYCYANPCMFAKEPIELTLDDFNNFAKNDKDILSDVVKQAYDSGYKPEALYRYFPDLKQIISDNPEYFRYLYNIHQKQQDRLDEISEDALYTFINQTMVKYSFAEKDPLKIAFNGVDAIFQVRAIAAFLTQDTKVNRDTWNEGLFALLLLATPAKLDPVNALTKSLTSKTIINTPLMSQEAKTIKAAFEDGPIPLSVTTERARYWIAGSTNKIPKLPKSLITKPNDFNKYGAKYTRLAKSPLLEEEVDKRFFDPDGIPKQELMDIYERVKAASMEVLGNPHSAIYVVGGSVAKRKKTGYNSDLNFYIKTDKVSTNEVRQTVDVETNNLAYQIAVKVNGGVIPAHSKDPKYIDVMLSSFYPYEYSGFILEIGDSAIFYDISQKAWYLVETYGLPDLSDGIPVVLRSSEWNHISNLPPSKYSQAVRFSSIKGGIPVPREPDALSTFRLSVEPAIIRKKGFPVSDEVLVPIADNVKRAIGDFEDRTGRYLNADTNFLDNLVENGTVYIVRDIGDPGYSGYNVGDMIVLDFDRYDSPRGFGSLHHEMFHALTQKNPRGFVYGGVNEKDKVFTAIYELMTDAWADIAMNQRVMSAGSHIATGGYASRNPILLKVLFNKLFKSSPQFLDNFLEFAIQRDANKLMFAVTGQTDFDRFFTYIKKSSGINFKSIIYRFAVKPAYLSVLNNQNENLFFDPIIEIDSDFILDDYDIVGLDQPTLEPKSTSYEYPVEIIAPTEGVRINSVRVGENEIDINNPEPITLDLGEDNRYVKIDMKYNDMTERSEYLYFPMITSTTLTPTAVPAPQEEEIVQPTEESKQEGEECIYPELCSDGVNTHTCQGSIQSGICKYDQSIDPSCTVCP